jgi:hypothetical protein
MNQLIEQGKSLSNNRKTDVFPFATNKLNWISHACLKIKCLCREQTSYQISAKQHETPSKDKAKLKKQTYLSRQIEGSQSSH